MAKKIYESIRLSLKRLFDAVKLIEGENYPDNLSIR